MNTTVFRFGILTGFMASAFAMVFTAPVPSASATTSAMSVVGPTKPPIGHYHFCQRRPGECTAQPGASDPVVMNGAAWRAMNSVNREVNASVFPLTDMEMYGVEEIWSYPDQVGDCEDYVLEKRRQLMALGFSASNLLITVVLQPNREGHAVLTVRTSQGDFILDNMRDEIRHWRDTEYVYIKRQSQTHAGRWDKLRDGRANTVGSVMMLR